MCEAGYHTEYSDNYSWDHNGTDASAISPGPGLLKPQTGTYEHQLRHGALTRTGHPDVTSFRSTFGNQPGGTLIKNTDFFSEQYPSIWRETIVKKDDRGKYIDPFKDVISKPYGRRLMYDATHPQMMYGSQWSSELADPNGCYSFPTTTGLQPEMPWTKDMSWQMESQEGHWPTDVWKNWTHIGLCPTYDGHTDQVEYSQYKTHVP